MKLKLFVLMLLFAAGTSAQSNLGNYFSRGIFGRGVGDIGSRGGEQVDLRFYVGLSGTVDQGYQGLTTDSKGNLINPGLLTGMDLNGGVYGVHSWKRAQLGLDYRGDLRHYPSDSRFDGTSNSLQLGYTFHPTSRVTLDFREGASQSTQSTYGYFSNVSDPNAIAASNLLDSRFYGLNSDASVSYLLDARTSITVGGGGRYQYRRTPTKYETVGFNAVGNVIRRMSARTSLGVDYSFMRDQARDDSFTSSVHTVLGRYILQIGPAWMLNIGAGVFIANVDQRTALLLDPALAAIFGTNILIVPTQTQKVGPIANVTMTRQFRRSSLTFSGSRSVMGGAGVYVTSEAESVGISYGYRTPRRWSFYISASDLNLHGIGTNSADYNTLVGGTGFSYMIVPTLHLTGNYDIRHLDVTQSGYKRNPSRASLGLTFSPGSIPLSFR